MEVTNGVNKKYKDSLIRALFRDEENSRALCSAITGKECDTLIDVTLDDAIFMEQINDMAFLLDDRLIVLIEHQSSINYNMPLRMLIYAGRIYEKVVDSELLYRCKMQEIPNIEFYVLYNGKEEFPEKMSLKLSDMYKHKNKKIPIPLELYVEIYNINEGFNSELMSKCKALDEYAAFVALMRKHHKKGGSLKKAVKTVIAECKKLGILEKLIKRYTTEIENMVLTGWDTEVAKKVWREEGFEDGMEKGRKKALSEVFALLEKEGYPTAGIKKKLQKA